jgi:hypothetical protein
MLASLLFFLDDVVVVPELTAALCLVHDCLVFLGDFVAVSRLVHRRPSAGYMVKQHELANAGSLVHAAVHGAGGAGNDALGVSEALRRCGRTPVRCGMVRAQDCSPSKTLSEIHRQELLAAGSRISAREVNRSAGDARRELRAER